MSGTDPLPPTSPSSGRSSSRPSIAGVEPSKPAGLLVIIAIGVVIAGVAGFLVFEEYIYPDPRLLAATVCCLPAVGVAVILIVVAVVITRMRPVRITQGPSASRASGAGGHTGHPTGRVRLPDRRQLEKKRESLVSVLESLDEQHGSGLIFDDAYKQLQKKYQRELATIDRLLDQLRERGQNQGQGVDRPSRDRDDDER